MAKNKNIRAADSYANLQARVGLGAGSIQDASSYGFSPITRNRIQLEFAYRSSWTCGMAIDLVADDMTSQGIDIICDDSPDDIKKINMLLVRLRIWNKLNRTIKWARLYGGAIAVMMIDGQDMSTPLNIDSVKKGQFKGILVLDRWLVQPSLDDLVTDMVAEIGNPKYYTVIADAQALMNMKIHYTRVIRMEGIDIPYWQKISENGWGISVLERIWDRITAFDSATEGMAQLVYKAHLRTIKIKGMRSIIAEGGKAIEGLVKSIESIRQFQSNEGLTLLDGDDEFNIQTYSFIGLPETLLQLGEQLSGGTQIPLVRFFGQSPSGLNATGAADLTLYKGTVNINQESMLRTGLQLILELSYRSLFGRPPSNDIDFSFSELWQTNDIEKADIALKGVQAIVQAHESIGVGQRTSLMELKQLSAITGFFSNISDEEINTADNEPPEPELITTETKNDQAI